MVFILVSALTTCTSYEDCRVVKNTPRNDATFSVIASSLRERGNLRYESGFILITTMLFLLILSTLVFSILESGLLETKMLNFYQDKIRSFYEAEKKLLQTEEGLIANKMPEKFETINSDICGVTFCRFKTEAAYLGTKTCLETTFAKIDDAGCDVNPDKKIAGRQSFSVIKCEKCDD